MWERNDIKWKQKDNQERRKKKGRKSNKVEGGRVVITGDREKRVIE